MKLCIPTLDDRGLEATPSDHFGSAPFFTFVDTDTGEVQAIRNDNSHHAHGACRPLRALDAHPVEAIVCRGLGRRALSRLEGDGIQVFVTLKGDVGASVDAFKDGRLRLLTPDQACRGHDGGHGGGHGHAHAHTHGAGAGLGRGRGIGGGHGNGPGRGGGGGSL